MLLTRVKPRFEVFKATLQSYRGWAKRPAKNLVLKTNKVDRRETWLLSARLRRSKMAFYGLTTGVSPEAPHDMDRAIVGVDDGMMYQVPLRNTAKSVLPSPS